MHHQCIGSKLDYRDWRQIYIAGVNNTGSLVTSFPRFSGPARGSPAQSGPTSPPGPIPWAPVSRRLTPAAATAPALDTDPGTDPHTLGTGTRTSHTSPCGPEEAPSRFLAWRQGAASPAQLTGAAATEVTAVAVAAIPAEEARTEAVRGRGGNTEHHQSRPISESQQQSLHSWFCKTVCVVLLSITCYRLILVNIFLVKKNFKSAGPTLGLINN